MENAHLRRPKQGDEGRPQRPITCPAPTVGSRKAQKIAPGEDAGNHAAIRQAMASDLGFWAATPHDKI